jgi:hypothetical protein
VAGGGVGGEFVVVTAQVLSQCVPGGDDPRGPVASQSAHRSQPRFRRPWSASTGFVRVALTVCSAEGISSSRSRGQAGARSVVTSAGIVPARSARVKNRRAARQITPGGEQHVDDLAVLVDGSVQIDPPAGNLDVCLIAEPAVTRGMRAEPRNLNELRSEPLDPSVDGDVIDADAALRQPLLGVAVGQVIAQVPADRDGDHLRGNRKPANTEKDRCGVTAPVSCPPRSANATPLIGSTAVHRVSARN